MIKRQHKKGKKRPRSWHRTNKESKLWLKAIKIFDRKKAKGHE